MLRISLVWDLSHQVQMNLKIPSRKVKRIKNKMHLLNHRRRRNKNKWIIKKIKIHHQRVNKIKILIKTWCLDHGMINPSLKNKNKEAKIIRIKRTKKNLKNQRQYKNKKQEKIIHLIHLIIKYWFPSRLSWKIKIKKIR
jgi:hypothetical protein